MKACTPASLKTAASQLKTSIAWLFNAFTTLAEGTSSWVASARELRNSSGLYSRGKSRLFKSMITLPANAEVAFKKLEGTARTVLTITSQDSAISSFVPPVAVNPISSATLRDFSALREPKTTWCPATDQAPPSTRAIFPLPQKPIFILGFSKSLSSRVIDNSGISGKGTGFIYSLSPTLLDVPTIFITIQSAMSL